MGSQEIFISKGFIDEAACNGERVRTLEIIQRELKDVRERGRFIVAECLRVPVMGEARKPG